MPQAQPSLSSPCLEPMPQAQPMLKPMPQPHAKLLPQAHASSPSLSFPTISLPHASSPATPISPYSQLFPMISVCVRACGRGGRAKNAKIHTPRRRRMTNSGLPRPSPLSPAPRSNISRSGEPLTPTWNLMRGLQIRGVVNQRDDKSEDLYIRGIVNQRD